MRLALLVIKEKHMKSIRYLWRLVVYTTNTCLLLFTFGVIKCCLCLINVDNLSAFLGKLKGYVLSISGATYVVIGFAGLVCILVCVGLLMSLSHYISYDMDYRKPDYRLLSAMGYQSDDLIWYERVYFLTDFLFSWVVASILTRIFIMYLERGNQGLATLYSVLNMKSLLAVPDYLIVAAILLLLAIWTIARNLERERR